MTPIFKRTVVQMRIITEVSRNKVEQACLLPDVAIRRQGVAGLYARCVEELSQRCLTFEFI
jgi:hypothetical protein